jgi:hypothetical protein
MIHARPQLNGNTVEDFTAAFCALGAAEKAIEAALASLRTNVFHVRNYQHLSVDDAWAKNSEDRQGLEPIRAGLQAIVDMKLAVVGAIQPERPPSRRTKVPGCPSCENDAHGPAHYASPNCQSGGHNHCSCDTCF